MDVCSDTGLTSLHAACQKVPSCMCSVSFCSVPHPAAWFWPACAIYLLECPNPPCPSAWFFTWMTMNLQGHLSVVKALLRWGASLHLLTNDGKSSLFFALWEKEEVRFDLHPVMLPAATEQVRESFLGTWFPLPPTERGRLPPAAEASARYPADSECCTASPVRSSRSIGACSHSVVRDCISSS